MGRHGDRLGIGRDTLVGHVVDVGDYLTKLLVVRARSGSVVLFYLSFCLVLLFISRLNYFVDIEIECHV